ncbi:MAG: hypothetical protein SW833_01670 [Cyanobacteriota bacterium]|nr:hypothetical protein [Cyanobacteriota bacterium]
MTSFLPIPLAILLLSLGSAIARSPQTPSFNLPLPPTPNRFFVECHCFISTPDEEPQEYGYHLRAIGRAENVPNGIEVTLDRDRLLLSVDRRAAGQQDYSPLLDSISPIPPSDSFCRTENCSTEYQFQPPPAELVVTYNKERGTIQVQHQLDEQTLLQGQGGCAILALPGS